MPNLNKVFQIGHLTRDPQLTFLPSQTPVVEFGIATSRKYKKQDGTQTEETCFITCKMFGKRAEVINKYVKKGDPIFVEGHLTFSSWDAKDGSKRSKHEIMVDNFEFLGGQSRTKHPDQTDADVSANIDSDIPF